MKDWECKGACEVLKGYYYGHKQVLTFTHVENITLKRNQGCKSNWGKNLFYNNICRKIHFWKQRPTLFFLNPYSLKGNLKNMESHQPYAANNHSDHYEYRLGLNIYSNMCENQRFKNVEWISQYDQFERSLTKGLLFFNQQTFSPHSELCNVGNKGRVFIQPSSFSRYHSRDNVEQHYMCNQMSDTLSKSPMFNNYESVYNGTGGYPCIEAGNTIDQDSNLMKHQRTQFSENH